MSRYRLACFSLLLGSVAGCGSTAPTQSTWQIDAGAALRDAGSVMSPVSAGGTLAAAGTGGAGQVGAGASATSGRSAGASATAGLAGVGGTQSDAGVPHACTIPDELVVLDEDADGGVDPSCQNVPRKIIAENCIGAICHDSNGPPAGGLNLMAPCVAERLVNVKSHCQDLLIVDTAHPSQSFLFDKLNAVMPKCGETMPFTGHLRPNDLACMNAWINAVIRLAK